MASSWKWSGAALADEAMANRLGSDTTTRQTWAPQPGKKYIWSTWVTTVFQILSLLSRDPKLPPQTQATALLNAL